MNKVVWTISLVPAMVYLGGRRRMGKRMEPRESNDSRRGSAFPQNVILNLNSRNGTSIPDNSVKR